MQFKTKSEKETKYLAQKLSRQLIKRGQRVIALTGELGSGKTTFIQGFAKGLKIQDKIISPTFVLIRQHKIPNTQNIFYHIDLYRLDDQTQLKALGLNELLTNPQNIVLLEWADKAKSVLPKNTIWINFKQTSLKTRQINLVSAKIKP